MCGSGNAASYADAVAANLVSRGFFASSPATAIYDHALFRYYDPDSKESDPDYIPNTTNQITFEAKVTGGTWTTGPITVRNNQQLQLRWSADAYARCLPFIADSGAYSLSRGGNFSLTSGNTEAEGYDVVERTSTYRIECDGQANGEDGVDIREIEVQVE